MAQLVILAGGKGTRLAERLCQADGTLLPKPLVQIGGMPLLERQLLHAKANGFCKVLLLVNHRAEVIENFCNTCPSLERLDVQLINDGEPRGTAGAVFAAFDSLEDEFCVMYGDTLLNVDLERMHARHVASGAGVTLFVHPNSHPQDSDLLEPDEDGNLIRLHPYPHQENRNYRNLVNAALYYMRREALAPYRQMPVPSDFAKDVFPLMLADGCRVSLYASPEYIKDTGTPSRLDEAEADIVSGRFAAQTLRQPQQAVFLDRDGVINQERGHISKVEDMVLLPGVAKAIKKINKSGMLAVVVTNQPVVARGECDEAELRRIHDRLETLLGLEGAYIDRLYCCPHHPDKGFAGERTELKIHCRCRKPETGMLELARDEMHIDLASSWLVGDRTGDILCAQQAGVKAVLVKTGDAGRDAKFDVIPDMTVADLNEAVDAILTRKAERV